MLCSWTSVYAWNNSVFFKVSFNNDLDDVAEREFVIDGVLLMHAPDLDGHIVGIGFDEANNLRNLN